MNTQQRTTLKSELQKDDWSDALIKFTLNSVLDEGEAALTCTEKSAVISVLRVGTLKPFNQGQPTSL